MRRCLGFLPLLVLALPAFAEELYLNVQPVQICDSTGANCADPSQQLFADFTNAIWSQADITVNFLPWQVIDNTSYDTGTGFTDEFQNSPSDLQPDAELDYLYFVPEPVVDDAYGSSVLGVGYIDFGVAFVSDSIFGFSSGNVYPDDQITSAEVTTARESSLLTDAPILATPEPGTLGLAAFALALACWRAD